MKSSQRRLEQKPPRILGLMSGTSLDGLDIALVKWNSDDLNDFKLEKFETYHYSNEFRNRIMEGTRGAARDLSDLNFQLGYQWAELVNRFLEENGIAAELINCLGSHGQTLWHDSGRSTLQLGESAVLAKQTGIPVVSNFREHDIAVGGTGAPLIPFLDWLLYRNLPGKSLVLNLGGIANITCLWQGIEQEDVRGWDTGPGNMVIDTLMEILSNGSTHYDDAGTLALQGQVDAELLSHLMEDDFIQAEPPKSTGRERYSDKYVREHFSLTRTTSSREQPRLLATGSEWTIAAVASNVQQYWENPEEVDRIIVSGGGIKNQFFMQSLASHFSNANIVSTKNFGVPAEAKEAIGFAVFAKAFIREIPANMPGVTGANRSVIMGKLTV